MKIIDIVRLAGKSHKNHTGEFGIEIETETKSAYEYPKFTYWECHQDGSLRDYGVEYVLKQPVKYYQEVNFALEEFKDKTKNLKFIKDSPSTSVHVHINFLQEDAKTLGNFFTLYSMFENVLIRYSGPDRLSNLFCLPICDAEETYRNMINMIHNIQNRKYIGISLSEQAVKYAACNLSSLYKYGSIEIRSFRGETDIEKIRNWISVLYQILDYSRQDIDPKQIMMKWKERQGKFLDDVFRDFRKEIAHKDELELIDNNIWYAASIAYSLKDWSQFGVEEKIPEFKPKQKDLDTYSVNLFGRPFNELTVMDQEHVRYNLQLAHLTKYNKAGVKIHNPPAWQDAPRARQAQARIEPVQVDWNGIRQVRPFEEPLADRDVQRDEMNRVAQRVAEMALNNQRRDNGNDL